MARTKISLEAQPKGSTGPKADLVNDAVASDDEAMSRTDRFLITSMVVDDYPAHVGISENTLLGDSSLSSVMERGRFELCDDLRPEDCFESMHVMYLLNLQKIAWDCLKEVPRNKLDLHLRDINLRYALRAIDTFIRLYDQLESHWAKKNSMPSSERILVPLTPSTLIDGTALGQIMEWARVNLYLELQPKDPFESMLADLAVRTHRAAWDCHEQADWKRDHPDVRQINLQYALKLTESSARLSARLESYRAKKVELLVTADRNPKVLSGKLARASTKPDKAHVHLNGNGKHP